MLLLLLLQNMVVILCTVCKYSVCIITQDEQSLWRNIPQCNALDMTFLLNDPERLSDVINIFLDSVFD